MHNVEANGAAIPALGFGTFKMTGKQAVAGIRHALDIGYRHIDTAQMYGNEAEVGQAIAESGISREDVFLTTKVWVDRFPPDRFAVSVDESLRKLNSGYVDLLLLHWPNPDVPLAETIGELNAVKVAGKTRHIGVSNYTTKLLAAAVAASDEPLVTNQVEYHPLISQEPVLQSLRRAGMCLTAYSPLAQARLVADPILSAVGRRYGKTAAQVALRWLVQQDGVVAIPKASSGEHASSNLDIFDFELSNSEMRRIDDMRSPEGRVVNPASLAPTWDR